jgi:hypothetical protein
MAAQYPTHTAIRQWCYRGAPVGGWLLWTLAWCVAGAADAAGDFQNHCEIAIRAVAAGMPKGIDAIPFCTCEAAYIRKKGVDPDQLDAEALQLGMQITGAMDPETAPSPAVQKPQAQYFQTLHLQTEAMIACLQPTKATGDQDRGGKR